MAVTEEQARPRRREPVFTGSASEYFRIWIVNVFLTVVTLGVYAAWAKVRTRRYFYANTLLDGQAFDYLANPVAILKGNLIVFAGFLAYILTEAYDPIYSGTVLGLFYLLLPFLIYKSLRFRAHNLVYRNIRFRFVGSLGDSYKTYLLLPLLIPFTLGLIVPYWLFRQKKYVFENFAFGRTVYFFDGRPGYFYKIYSLAALMSAAVLVLVGVGFSVYVPFALVSPASAQETPPALVFAAVAGLYLGMIVVFTLVQQYIHARLTNYCWGCTRLGQVLFESTLSARRLVWIRLTNILAILCSLGLLIPWAKVRRTRNVLDNLTVVAPGTLDEFTAAAEPDEGALGESATDFFDVEIGL